MELDTHYSVEDVYDLLEIALIDGQNSTAIAKQRNRKR